MTYSAFLQQFPTSLSKREKQYTKILTIKKKNNIPNLPSGEGSGVCHACAQLLNSKQSLEADRYHFSSNLDKCSSSPNSSNMLLETVSRNTSTQTASLSVTHPFIPSQEGKQPRHLSLITNKNAAPKTSPHNILITKKKQASQTSPLGEGSGVCHACA